ncbi:MAG: septation ring formation regulator EzrA [Bacilli bacterium]|nr:septation ring formation regulator EzrA [Bacilli bacterium]
MDSVLLITVSAFLLAIILIIITIAIIKNNQSKKYKKEIEKLDIEKNSLLGVPILSEITKVKELVKTDNLNEKMNEWDTTFKLIRDNKIPELTDLISDVDFLIDKKDYKQAIKKIANIEMELKSLKKITEALLEEIKIITKSEERNRTLITKLKIVYREQQNKFERSSKDYGEIGPFIEDEFKRIDKLFVEFEKAMDNNDYVSVEKKIVNLDDKIIKMGKLLEDAPTIVLMATVLIPNKIEEASIYYYRMKRDGYPLDYLNVEYNIKEIKDKIVNIINELKNLTLGDSIIELKTFIEYFNQLYNDFDKEKECKDLFRQNIKELGYRIENINKVVRDIYLQIDDIKYNYNLSNEDINKFSLLNKNLEKINKDYKILVEQGKAKTFAYSKLVDELDGLSLKLSRLQDDLDYQLRSITSMQDDETRAKEQLATIEDVLKKAKYRLKEYKIPVIPSSYYIELTEAQDAIREIVKELSKKPIVIKILNIRVDTARDLVFKIYNKTNDMIKTVTLAEKIIIYGNRYRSSYEEIDIALNKAEELFKRGKYKESLDLSLKSLSFIDKNVMEKIQ